MRASFTTADVGRQRRSQYWHETISRAYFPLDLTFSQPETFNGSLQMWELGNVSLSRLTSDAIFYRRFPGHFQRSDQEEFLVTLPVISEVRFSQCGREVCAEPGSFFVERSHEPYEFSHAERADIFVMKLSSEVFSTRLQTPDRFCSLKFDTKHGVGALFADLVRLVPARYQSMSEEARAVLGWHLIDLLSLALHADKRILTSSTSPIRTAHLRRIESFVLRHIEDPNLGPDEVAAGCGISVRYLHRIFRDTNQTLGQWIRNLRLEKAHEDLRTPTDRRSIGEIAYTHGFSDQAQFSRAFRTRFGISPKETRIR